MTLKLYTYPSCSSCRNAKNWLEEHELDYEAIHILKEPPNEFEIKEMIETSGLPPKKFFNTNGKVYKELGLKNEIDSMSLEKMVTLLASDGMLIKRPIVTDGKNVTVGFKADIFNEKWLQK